MLLFERRSHIRQIDGQGTVFFVQAGDLNAESASTAVPGRRWLRYTKWESA